MNDQALPTLAVFDFDHTLIRGDSFWPFLTSVGGWPRSLLALMEAFYLFGQRWRKDKSDPSLADLRTFIKARLLQKLLAGKTPSELAPAIAETRAWQKWNGPMRQALLDHALQNHKIVIISGALDLYLPALTADLPPHKLISTQMEIRDGVVTGIMRSGNCVRGRKAELLAEFLAQNGPFADSWGYGNFPHDVPMLGLLKHRILV